MKIELYAFRTPRLERYASETNKLIIRIDKLLKERPTDPVQRKLHDQKVGRHVFEEILKKKVLFPLFNRLYHGWMAHPLNYVPIARNLLISLDDNIIAGCAGR